MDKLIVLSVKCPNCDLTLMDSEHLIDGEPGIKVAIEAESGRGLAWLSPVYNCFNHESTVYVKDKEIVSFYCPHCNSSLIRDVLCKLCKANMVGLNISIGGKVNFCSRKDCMNHYVLFENLSDAVRLLE